MLPSSSPPAGSRYFSTVPTFLALIDRDLPTVRLLVLGGEACMPELVDALGQARPAAAQHLRAHRGDGRRHLDRVRRRARPITIGRALPGYQAYVLDEQLQPVGAGEEGELFIGGDAVAPATSTSPS